MRADLLRHHCLADRTAGLGVMLAAESKLALPEIRLHFRQERSKFLAGDVPQTKFAHARRIDEPPAEVQLEHLQVGGGVTTLAYITLTDFFNPQAKPGLDRVHQRGLAHAGFSDQYRHAIL